MPLIADAMRRRTASSLSVSLNSKEKRSMKLYLTPGACSLSPHIVIRELGLDVAIEAVNLGTKVTASGADFRAINPKGYVPALVLDDGSLLTEGAVIVQYLADSKPEAGLLAKPGTIERYRTLEWLNFIAAEVHKGFSPLFRKDCPAEWQTIVRDTLGTRFQVIDAHLEGKAYLMGERFTVADAYLFTVLGWSRYVNLDLGGYANINAYLARVGERPGVQAALAAEKAAR
jgi:glutathione S-transferase